MPSESKNFGGLGTLENCLEHYIRLIQRPGGVQDAKEATGLLYALDRRSDRVGHDADVVCMVRRLVEVDLNSKESETLAKAQAELDRLRASDPKLVDTVIAIYRKEQKP